MGPLLREGEGKGGKKGSGKGGREGEGKGGEGRGSGGFIVFRSFFV